MPSPAHGSRHGTLQICHTFVPQHNHNRDVRLIIFADWLWNTRPTVGAIVIFKTTATSATKPRNTCSWATLSPRPCPIRTFWLWKCQRTCMNQENVSECLCSNQTALPRIFRTGLSLLWLKWDKNTHLVSLRGQLLQPQVNAYFFTPPTTPHPPSLCCLWQNPIKRQEVMALSQNQDW